MLLTITTTHRPATDLGYLMHKSPGRVHSAELPFGQAHVFYPQADDSRCTATLLLEVDPVALSRGRRGRAATGMPLQPFVNDRPYAASSFLSVAIARVLGSALGGRSRERPELVDAALPLEATVAAVPSDGGAELIGRVFEPLGYDVTADGEALDARSHEWGPSPYFRVRLTGTLSLRTLLNHLYVLIPVLDAHKHYWITEDEVAKLLRRGEGWLAGHPERELITRRYLGGLGSLTAEALARLADDDADPERRVVLGANEEAALEAPLRLQEQRVAAVRDVLRRVGARRVLDIGCGEGDLIAALLEDPTFVQVVGMDVSHRALQIARERLRLDRRPTRQAERVELIQGSLAYRDRRLAGFDAATVLEVIEHLDPDRLPAAESVIFEHARPRLAVVTTPNAEYNARFAGLPERRFRHRDHRFEWTRAQFGEWGSGVARRFGYTVELGAVGAEDPRLGAPTQMAIFERVGEDAA